MNTARSRGLSASLPGSIHVYTGSWMNASASTPASRETSVAVAIRSTGRSILGIASTGSDRAGDGDGICYAFLYSSNV